jgi:hypothetical protein
MKFVHSLWNYSRGRPRICNHPKGSEIARQLGISRAAQWRAKKIADIPEEEFESLIERETTLLV